MAEIRHLENRHDVIFCRGWNLADWCRMTCRLRRYGRNRNRKSNSNTAYVFFQTGNSYILAVDWVITTKFGLLIDTDLLKKVTTPNPKPEVKLCHSGCHLENRYEIISPLQMLRIGWNLAIWCRMNCPIRWYNGNRNRK